MRAYRPELMLLLGLLACGGNAQPGGVARESSAASEDTHTITAEQVASSGGATAWDVVDRLHRRWFRDQLSGKDVTVYENDQSVGAADRLRVYPARDVAELRYVDGQKAVRRWGPGLEGGVIVVVRNRS